MDTGGKGYIDLLSGFSVNNLDHCYEEIIGAIKNQFQKLPQYFGIPNALCIEFSKNFVK